MANSLQICNVKIHPGEQANLALPLPELYTCTTMHMPIKVLHGKDPGPCILIFAAVSGCEMNGFEIINRLLKHEALKQIKGTLIAVPVMNVYGMVHYPIQTPSSTKIDGCFPGKPDGSFGERIAHIFTQEILSKTDYCIELDTGALSHNILPQVYCNFDNKEAKRLAKAFSAPVIIDVKLENNQLRQTTESLNIPFVSYEAGEAMRFCEHSIQIGLNGLLRIMSKLEMLSLDIEEEDISPFFAQDDDWIRASKSGVVRTEVSLGQRIKEKEKIAMITDPFSADISEPIYSPFDGIVVGINETPLIQEGQSLFKVVTFADNRRVEAALEQWDQEEG